MPLIGKRLKVSQPGIVFLEADEILLLLGDSSEPIWNRMAAVAVDTGMRLGELLGLPWKDIDLDNGMIHVRQSYVRGRMDTPKSGKMRSIPMTKRVDAALFPYHQRDGLVFAQADGSPLTSKMASTGLIRMNKRTGLKHIGWHVLRHTFASQLVMRGVPMRHIQQLFGHSSIATTERYAHLAPSSLKDAVAVLDSNMINFGQYLGSEKFISSVSELEHA